MSYDGQMPLQSDKLRLLRRIPDIRFEEESRGYSRDQVDRVLANLAPLADEIERLQARLSEAETRAASAEARLVEARGPSQVGGGEPGMPAPGADFDETLRNTLLSAQRQADVTLREAQEESERLRTEAELQSNALLADARDQSAEMTTEAVSYRESLMAEASTERATMLDDAKEEASTKVKAVERELSEAHDSERNRLVAEISSLKERHNHLNEDVVRFEKHIESRTEQIRASLSDITKVLDDPDSLKSSVDFEAAEIEDFRSEDYPPIAVEVVALNELEAEAQMANDAVSHPSDVLDAADLEELVEEPALPDAPMNDNVLLDNEVVVVDDIDHGAVAFTATSDLPLTDGFIDDPQVGVDTQVVAPPPIPANLEEYEQVPFNNDTTQQPSNGGVLNNDPFLSELKRVTNEEPGNGDAVDAFLEDSRDDRGGGWFGRRK